MTPARLVWAVGAILAALAAAAAGVAAPLAVYSVTLAAFGLPHVLSELRYVDRRFGRSLGGLRLAAMLVLLAAIVAARAANLAGRLRPDFEIPLELTLVAALALTAVRGSWLTGVAAVTVALAIGCLTLADPFTTMVGFSVLHNLTPLGFLWQLAPRRRRAATMAWASLGLVGLPLLVASGWPRLVLTGLIGDAGQALDPLNAGPLYAQLPVYVPHALLPGANAIDLFSASVVAQQGHYASVIVVLPWLLSRWSPGAKGLVPWPRGWIFYGLIAAAGAFALSRFTLDFAAGRSVYSLFAAFHAWIEIPILVWALTAPQPISSPMPNEAPLVTSESGRA